MENHRESNRNPTWGGVRILWLIGLVGTIICAFGTLVDLAFESPRISFLIGWIVSYLIWVAATIILDERKERR